MAKKTFRERWEAVPKPLLVIAVCALVIFAAIQIEYTRARKYKREVVYPAYLEMRFGEYLAEGFQADRNDAITGTVVVPVEVIEGLPLVQADAQSGINFLDHGEYRYFIYEVEGQAYFMVIDETRKLVVEGPLPEPYDPETPYEPVSDGN